MNDLDDLDDSLKLALWGLQSSLSICIFDHWLLTLKDLRVYLRSFVTQYLHGSWQPIKA